MITKLRDIAIKASKQAYSPYSKANVGSALETNDGRIYYGCNIENSSFGATVCAERVAIFKAISDFDCENIKNLRIKMIYIYTDAGWPPCGICRQVMSEFADKNLQVIIGDKDQNEKKVTFKDILPFQYTKDYLLT